MYLVAPDPGSPHRAALWQEGTEANISSSADHSSGYAHGAYAHALSEFGQPLRLERCGGHVLERPIPDSGRSDAMGPYPLFACADWSGLAADLEALGAGADPARIPVSLTMVTDPLADCRPEALRECFPDLARPFKDHFVTDLSRPLESVASGHHRRDARGALKKVEVQLCRDPARWLEPWARLYGELIERHGITGIAAFSSSSFDRQLRVPGTLLFRAEAEGEVVGMLLWYRRGEVASYHLAAQSLRGYELGASYALMWRALEDLASTGCRWAHLGAGAGAAAGDDGLTWFKRGWATETRPAWLCGRIFDRDAYGELTRVRGRPGSEYFPLYRAGEFE